jgi:hypothetical protein
MDVDISDLRCFVTPRESGMGGTMAGDPERLPRPHPRQFLQGGTGGGQRRAGQSRSATSCRAQQPPEDHHELSVMEG